jgi:PST family polysaccharide transporter
VLLGPKWVGVVLPFQILASSLVFRTGYKMSGSLIRATGAVYSRAWREWVYAACVIGGAYLGHFKGSGGVAAGVVAAIAINFVLMLDLSHRITGVSWGKIAKIHLRHLMIALLIGLPVLGTAILARAEGWHGVFVIGAAVAVAGAIFLGLAKFVPAVFGDEGQWAWSLIKSKLPKRLRDFL